MVFPSEDVADQLVLLYAKIHIGNSVQSRPIDLRFQVLSDPEIFIGRALNVKLPGQEASAGAYGQRSKQGK
jgi:hypothetical protein